MKLVQKRDSSEHWQGYEIAIDDPTYDRPQKRLFHFIVRLAAKWPDDAIEVRTKERYATALFRHLVVNYDGSGKASGLKLYVDGKPAETEVVKDNLSGTFRTAAPLEIGNKANGKPFEGELDDLRIYNRPVNRRGGRNLAIRLPARSVLVELAGKTCPGDRNSPAGKGAQGSGDRRGRQSRDSGGQEGAPGERTSGCAERVLPECMQRRKKTASFTRNWSSCGTEKVKLESPSPA